MPTYAENAHRREVVQRRVKSDRRDAEVHRAFDRLAQDNVAKFERPKFAVVGEGSHAAQDAYRRNYDTIFGSRRVGHGAVHTAPASSPGCSGAGVTG